MSGCVVTRLTNYRGHSHHIVGDGPCWLDGGRRLVLISDREGCSNLFTYDFTTAALVQITDLRGTIRPERVRPMSEARLGFWYGAGFYELELATLRIRETPPPAEQARSSYRLRNIFRAGELVLSERRRAIWMAARSGADRIRRVVAFSGGTGRPPYATTAPSVQPSGQHVIFVSDEDGYAQVFSAKVELLSTLRRLAALGRGDVER